MGDYKAGVPERGCNSALPQSPGKEDREPVILYDWGRLKRDRDSGGRPRAASPSCHGRLRESSGSGSRMTP